MTGLTLYKIYIKTFYDYMRQNRPTAFRNGLSPCWLYSENFIMPTWELSNKNKQEYGLRLKCAKNEKSITFSIFNLRINFIITTLSREVILYYLHGKITK